jgi:hypothetical protein
MQPPGVDAVIVTFLLLATPSVETVNVFSVRPALTVTDAGTGIDGSDEVKLTFAPPDGAGSFNRTRKVTVKPPVALPDPKMKFTQGAAAALVA